MAEAFIASRLCQARWTGPRLAQTVDRRVVASPPRSARYGTAPGGRIFFATRGGLIQDSTYIAVWQDARTASLTIDQQAFPAGGRPYDLRHVGVSLIPTGQVQQGETGRMSEDLEDSLQDRATS